MTIGEFIQTKPLIFWPPTIVLVIGALYMFVQGLIRKKIKINPFKNADLLRQKMAPALNETTGFLLVSYVVILCIGNVIMKTSPKYLTKFSEESVKTKKVKGVVSSLQQSNMSWLPFMIASIGIAIASFIPFEDKKLKIIIIGIILIVSIIIALIFNEISNLFRKKESFTNVKEEFGHMVEGKRHPFKIAVGTSEMSTDAPHVVYFRYDNSEEDHIKDSSHHQSPGTTNFGISSSSNIEIENEFFNNQLTIGLHEGKEQDADIYYSEFPWGSPGGETTLKKIKDPLTITVESKSKTIFFHSFKKGTLIFKSPPTIATKGDTNYKLDDNGIAYIDTSGKETMKDKEYCVWEQHNTDTKKLKTGKPVNVESIVFWGGDKNKPMDYITDSSLPLGVVIKLKNIEQFFGFDAGKVKDSVRASYIAYYCLVWGSFLVYMSVNAYQQKKWIWYTNKPWPFLVAALVETLLIGQSHYSLDDSDVGSFGKASPIFNYAVAGFATRIATVVAFLSYIIMKVKD
tara:strand:+ start:2390 stop:3931 length:1542 start_codon:yes stop_codon:yes gene_type:complete